MGILKKMFGGGESKPAAPSSSAPEMRTLDSSRVVEPFAEINVWPLPNGGKRVRAYVLVEHAIEGMQTGVAIDGSASMRRPFGKVLLGSAPPDEVEKYKRRGMVRIVQQDNRSYYVWAEGALKELVARGIFHYTDNIVEPQVRQMASYLAQFDADGGTTVIYWATGKDGRQLDVVGDLTGAQCSATSFAGPKEFGEGTYLLPAIKYFVERFTTPPWGLYVFITDGALHDLAEVKRYCISLAREIAGGRRNQLKFVLVGVGEEVDERQMCELDDLETGTSVDLWDHKIAKEMRQLAEIFAEAVSESVVIAPGMGVVRDPQGNILKDYRDTGLPALIEFDMPPGATAFTLDVGGQVITQPLV